LKKYRLDAAVVIPITLPAVLTSGPPESPDSTGASVSISPDSCSAAPLVRDPAVMERLSPVTRPATALGVPPSPPALPIATTGSPTFRDEESATDTVERPDAPCSCSTAMSPVMS
jgi:hypothetical protein